MQIRLSRPQGHAVRYLMERGISEVYPSKQTIKALLVKGVISDVMGNDVVWGADPQTLKPLYRQKQQGRYVIVGYCMEA